MLRAAPAFPGPGRAPGGGDGDEYRLAVCSGDHSAKGVHEAAHVAVGQRAVVLLHKLARLAPREVHEPDATLEDRVAVQGVGH